MSDADYTSHLRSLGVDPHTLKLDSNGTLGAPAPAQEQHRLPRVTVTASADTAADLTVLRTLGTGGMGEVMLAVQKALGREVALKRLQPDHGISGAPELLREALVTGRLEHPNIVPVHMLALAQDGTPFFVMKRIEGTPWRKLLKDHAALQRLTREKAEPLVLNLDIFLAVCDAVSFAHSRGVLHRDLKPDNVMVGAFGEVYVLDWGIAIGLRPDSGLPLARDISAVTGTPAYMAPEMAAADGAQLSERTDVFLLGAMLYELVAGRPPHVGDDPLDTLDRAWRWSGPPADLQAPEGLAEVIRTAMARKTSDRYASVDALRAAVVQFMRNRDAMAIAAEAKMRAAALSVLLAKPAPHDEVALHQVFSEARFGFSQAVRIWPQFESAKRGLDEVTIAMARHELAGERPGAARALLAQLSTPDAELTAAVTALEASVSERKARLDALERDTDLDKAVALRAVMAFIQGIICGVFILVMGMLTRRGIAAFAHREALIGVCVFAFVHLVFIDRALRPKLNLVGRRALNANTVALLSFVGFWTAAWVLQIPFHSAVVMFMLFVAMGWGLAAAVFDARTGVVSATYTLAAAAVWAWPGAMFELFGGATIAAFALLGLMWRGALKPTAG